MLPSKIIMWLLGTKKVTLLEITNLAQTTQVTLNNTLGQTCQIHHLPPTCKIAIGCLHCDGVPFQKSTHNRAMTKLFEKHEGCLRSQHFPKTILMQLWVFWQAHIKYIAQCLQVGLVESRQGLPSVDPTR